MIGGVVNWGLGMTRRNEKALAVEDVKRTRGIVKTKEGL
jgi:hypothetical protein